MDKLECEACGWSGHEAAAGNTRNEETGEWGEPYCPECGIPV